MSRCQICNYCEATGSPSQYESTEAVHMSVQYRKSVNQDLCEACWESIKMNRTTYRFEKDQIEFDWNAREIEEDNDPPWDENSEGPQDRRNREERGLVEEVERNTPALSEV